MKFRRVLAFLTAAAALVAGLAPLSVFATRPIRVACIGDSITAGSGLEHPSRQSYPAQLGELLGDAYDVRNFGVSGATLIVEGDKPYRTQPAFVDALRFAPDIVVIALGTNDTKPQNWAHRDRFVHHYIRLIGQISEMPETPRIFICRPMPAWPPSGWGISPEVIEHELPPLLAEVARSERVTLIDLFTPLRDRPELAPDHVHPNAEGAALIAQTVAAAIRAARR